MGGLLLTFSEESKNPTLLPAEYHIALVKNTGSTFFLLTRIRSPELRDAETLEMLPPC